MPLHRSSDLGISVYTRTGLALSPAMQCTLRALPFDADPFPPKPATMRQLRVLERHELVYEKGDFWFRTPEGDRMSTYCDTRDIKALG